VTLHIGTSGWQYRDWRGTAYPQDEPQRRWLDLYGEQFATVEVNNSFYRLPSQEQFAAWASRVPDTFCFAVKASRYLTHIRRLREPDDAVRRLLDAAQGLGSKLGPVLLQLPPTLRADVDLLAAALGAFPSSIPLAVEFRHPSWESREVDAVLETRNAACVLADRRGGITGRRTASWAYVRLHEGRARPEPCYGRSALRSWVGRIVDEWGPRAEGYVYFNNDPHGCAFHNAAWFRRAARRAGITCA
jgi:uncharacterized protein YecE (DUF72 family)